MAFPVSRRLVFLSDISFDFFEVGVIVRQSCMHLNEIQMRIFERNILGLIPAL